MQVAFCRELLDKSNNVNSMETGLWRSPHKNFLLLWLQTGGFLGDCSLLTFKVILELGREERVTSLLFSPRFSCLSWIHTSRITASLWLISRVLKSWFLQLCASILSHFIEKGMFRGPCRVFFFFFWSSAPHDFAQYFYIHKCLINFLYKNNVNKMHTA